MHARINKHNRRHLEILKLDIAADEDQSHFGLADSGLKFHMQKAAFDVLAFVEILDGRANHAEQLIARGQNKTCPEQPASLGFNSCLDEQLYLVGAYPHELVEVDFRTDRQA
ncbi:hypothetical protein ES703_93041 [subsurface metagenome]